MPVIKDVPGVGPVEFVDEAAALKFKQQAGFGGAGGPFEQTLGQRAERMFDVGREALVEGAGPALRAVSPTMNIAEQIGLIDPGTTEQLGSGMANLFAAESIPEAATEATMAVLSGGASVPGTVAKRFAARTLIPPAIGAATAALTGTEDPAGVAAKGFIGTMLGEVPGALKRGVQNVGKKIIAGFGQKAQALKDVGAVSRALIKDIPGFKKVLGTGSTAKDAEKLILLSSKDRSGAVLSEAFEAFDDKAITAFKKAKNVDELISFPVIGREGQLINTKISVKEALKVVRDEKAIVRQLRKTQPDQLTFQRAEQTRQLENQLKFEFHKKDQVIKAATGKEGQLFKDYEKAVDELNRGTDLIDILIESKAIPQAAGEASGAVDLGVLAGFLGDPKNVKRFNITPDRFPNLMAAATRGAPLGARDIAGQFTARGFIPRSTVTPVGGAASFGVPFAKRAGEAAPISMFEATGPQLLADVIGTRGLFGGLPSERVRKTREERKLRNSPFGLE